MALVATNDGSAEGAITSAVAALSGSATAGNVLVSAIACDKNSGATPTPSAGWTLVDGRASASISFAVARRVADGTAADRCTWTWPFNCNNSWWIGELDGLSSPQFAFASNFTSEAAVTSVALGPVVAPGDGMALGFVGVDTLSNWITGGRAATWSNGFAEQDTVITVGGDVGMTMTWAPVSVGASVSSTATAARASGDQASGMLIVVGSAAVVPPPSSSRRPERLAGRLPDRAPVRV